MPQVLTDVLLEHHAVLRLLARHAESATGLEAFARVLGGHLFGMQSAFLPALMTIPTSLRLADEVTQWYQVVAQLLARVVDPREDLLVRVAAVGPLLVEMEKALQREKRVLLPAAVIGLSPALAASVAARMEALFLEFVGSEPTLGAGEAEMRGATQQGPVPDEGPQQTAFG